MEYTGNLQGKCIENTFFKKRKEKLSIFIMFSFFLNILWTKETPLIDPRGPQAAKEATSLSTALAHCWCNCPQAEGAAS